MKKTTLILTLCLASACSAQIVINSRYQPLTYEQLYIQALMEAEYEAKMKQKFEQYEVKAYQCYDNKDWIGFITNSNEALSTGFYNAKLYFVRGVVFERINDFKNAKKEYKRAKKKGYAYAANALEECKQHEKEFKRNQVKTVKRKY